MPKGSVGLLPCILTGRRSLVDPSQEHVVHDTRIVTREQPRTSSPSTCSAIDDEVHLRWPRWRKCRHGYLKQRSSNNKNNTNMFIATQATKKSTRNNQTKAIVYHQMITLSSLIIILLAVATNLSLAQLITSNAGDVPSRSYRLASYSQAQPSVFTSNGRQSQLSSGTAGNPAIVPQVWARGLATIPAGDQLDSDNGASLGAEQPSPSISTRRSSGLTLNRLSVSGLAGDTNSNLMKSVRHIVAGNGDALSQKSNMTTPNQQVDDICADRLCYGLPMGCATSNSVLSTNSDPQADQHVGPAGSNPTCSVLVTSKRFIDPERPVSRDILFELMNIPLSDTGTYAAVGFSENGRMQGLASECLHYREAKTQLEVIKLKHSYNLPGAYSNVPVTIISGIKELESSYENGYYQCRWIVESAVEFTYEATNGSLITRRDDLGYRNYHILLASGEYYESTDAKGPHTLRSSSLVPVSLAQTGHIKSLGAHILIRIHGSLMIAIWIGLVTLSIVLARYYKNEWSHSKLNDLAIWFVAHRALMLTAWFGTVIAIIFAYMYTETYHPGLHQLSGTACLVLTTVQVLGGLFRPAQDSSKRTYFNWTHFICGNLSYLCAMICLVTAAFLAPAHLPPLYIWVIVVFVATYALTHTMLTSHQYIVHKSSKISITPMSDLNSNSSTTYTSCGFVADSYPKEVNSPFRQFLLGIFVTIIVIFIVLLISLVNIK